MPNIAKKMRWGARGQVIKSLLFGLILILSFLPAFWNGSNNISQGFDYIKGQLKPNYTIHGIIDINGNSALISFPNKTGSGLQDHPYIIEGLQIDAGGAGPGIYIKNTDLYLTIRNCLVYNSGVGKDVISLYNCRNVNLSRNIVYNNRNGTGIYLHTCSDNVITGNNAIDNTCGIGLIYSSFNEIIDNDVLDNFYYGIAICEGNNNLIRENTAKENAVGIRIDWGADHNTIVYNNITHNLLFGIHAWTSSLTYPTNFNNVSGNFISQNLVSGIYIDELANSNMFIDNTVSFNSKYGICLRSTTGNTLYHNTILNNSWSNAYQDNASSNTWSNGTHGNYWGDYLFQNPSATNDGTFWSHPYYINGSTTADWHPLVLGGNVPPTITHPEDLAYLYGTIGHEISWTVTDVSTIARSFKIYRDGSLITNGSWTSGTPIVQNVDGLVVGDYNYTIVAVDGLDGVVNDTVIITALAAPPPEVSGYATVVISGSMLFGLAVLIGKIRRANPYS